MYQDMYDELIMIIGSRRSGLNQNLALKGQYDQALQDLADLIETGKEKMAGDHKLIVVSKKEIQQLLDKHKVKTILTFIIYSCCHLIESFVIL